MQKNFLPVLIASTLLLLLAQPAKALSIQIDDQGQIQFFAGQVLGKDSEEAEKKETESSDDDSKDDDDAADEVEQEIEHAPEVESEHARPEPEKPREVPRAEKKSEDKKPEPRKVLKNITTKENKLLKIKNNREKAEVFLEQKAGKPTPQQRKPENGSEEVTGSESFDIKLPVNQKPELRERSEDEKKAINEVIAKIKRERSERRDSLEFKSKINDDGTNELEIESGAIKAKLKSSEFAIDPATNEVKITTPNGTEHTLIHLPDQALQQMIATKKLEATDEIDQSELTLETKDDGSVVYKTKVTNKRKIFGFIPFNYESEVELNDADSEITSEPTDKSFIGQLLFRLSR